MKNILQHWFQLLKYKLNKDTVLYRTTTQIDRFICHTFSSRILPSQSLVNMFL